MSRWGFKFATGALLALCLSGCSVSPSALSRQSYALLPTGAPVPVSECRADNQSVLENTAYAYSGAGNPHYVEFRTRTSLLVAAGHHYAVHGTVAPDGRLVQEGVLALNLNNVSADVVRKAIFDLPIQGTTNAVQDDCDRQVAAAFRVGLTAEQYQRLMAFSDRMRNDPPAWRSFSYNCNHFAADIAQAVGMNVPQGADRAKTNSVKFIVNLAAVNGASFDLPVDRQLPKHSVGQQLHDIVIARRTQNRVSSTGLVPPISR